MRTYIIDGYNVVFNWGKFWNEKIEKGRENLIREIRKKKLHLKNKVKIIFDGKEGMWGGVSCRDIGVIFTQEENADDYIVKLVKKMDNPKLVVVVSNDNELSARIKMLGGEVKRVEEFFEETRKVRKEKKEKKLSPEELKEIEKELIEKWKLNS